MAACGSIYYVHSLIMVVELMIGTMFEASCYSVLSQTCQPSETSKLHGHDLNTETVSLNVCEEYEILNQSMCPSAFYQSADSEVVLRSIIRLCLSSPIFILSFI